MYHLREYPTWEAYIEAAHRPTDCEYRYSQTEGPSFWGCTYDEAMTMAKYGWLEGAQRAREISRMMFDRLGSLMERIDIEYDTEGQAIDIARYVEGEPE